MGEEIFGDHPEAMVKVVVADSDLISPGAMVGVQETVDREAMDNDDRLMVQVGNTIQEAISGIDLQVAAVQLEAAVVI
jgi:hypothetical protein